MRRLVRVIIYTLSLYIVTHLFVFAVLPVAILVSFVDRAKISDLKQWFVKSLFAIVGKKLKVSGYDKITPNRPYLIISNYPSFYAGFSLIGTFPRSAIVAHAFIKRIPLLGQLLKQLGTIFVRPGYAGQGKRALDFHLNNLDIASSIIILPEGARTPDGKIHRFKRGFLYILRQTSLDLLPITLNGFYQLKPMRRSYLDPDADLEMIIHQPINNEAARQMSDEELLTKVPDIIKSVYRP